MSRKAISGKSKVWMEFEYLLSFGDVTPPAIFGDEDEEPAKDFDKKLLNNFRKWLLKISADDLNHPNDDGETMLMVAIGDEKFTIAAEICDAGGKFNGKGEEAYFSSLKDFGKTKSEFKRALEEIRKESLGEEAKAFVPRAPQVKFVEPKPRAVNPEELKMRWCEEVGIVPAAAPVVTGAAGGGAPLAGADGRRK
jgi:hypothetical protein